MAWFSKIKFFLSFNFLFDDFGHPRWLFIDSRTVIFLNLATVIITVTFLVMIGTTFIFFMMPTFSGVLLPPIFILFLSITLILFVVLIWSYCQNNKDNNYEEEFFQMIGHFELFPIIIFINNKLIFILGSFYTHYICFCFWGCYSIKFCFNFVLRINMHSK